MAVTEQQETDHQVDKFDNMVEVVAYILKNTDGCDFTYVATEVVKAILEVQKRD